MVSSIGYNQQSVSAERIERMKHTVGRISANGLGIGSGFTVSDDGLFLTCWHVINSVIDSAGNYPTFTISFANGRNYQAALITSSDKNFLHDCVVNDFAYLKINTTEKLPYLIVGNYEQIKEGSPTYTAGFPFGINQVLTSTGILSSKFTQTLSNPLIFQGRYFNGDFKRNVAWLDITINKGNSGGPLIKIGEDIEQDTVVGIITFQMNPLASAADQLIEKVNMSKKTGASFTVSYGGNDFDFLQSSEMIAKTILNTSFGVGGCVSINYSKKYLK